MGSRSASRVALLLASLLVAGFLVVTLAWPVAAVLGRSLGSPPWEYYARELSRSSTRVILARTLRLSLYATVLTLLLAYPSAVAIAGLGRRLRGAVLAVLLVPYLTSFLVRTYGWISLLGVNGPIVTPLRAAGFGVPSLVGSGLAVVIVLMHVFLPLSILTIYVAVISVDARLLPVAASLGARPYEAFVRVLWPLTLPGVVAAATLTFIACVTAYVTPALIGGPSETTLVMLIVNDVGQLFDWRSATSLAVILLVLVAIVLGASAWLLDLSGLFGLGGGRFRLRRGALPHAAARAIGSALSQLPDWVQGRVVCRALLLVALAASILPLIYVIGVSFQPRRLLLLPAADWSIRWYLAVLSDPQWVKSASLTMLVAVVATPIALGVGCFLSWSVRVLPPAPRGILILLALAPLAVPTILLATGIYDVFVRLGWIGQMWAVALAHAMLAVPFVFVNILNGLARYDERLDAAAKMLGAAPIQVLLRVRLPLMAPAIATAAGFAFLTSVDEYLVTSFLAGPGLETLPLHFWAAASFDVSPALAVVGTLLMALVTLVGFAVTQVRSRGGAHQPALVG